MSSTDRIIEPSAKHARDPVVQGSFSYDVQDESWTWVSLVPEQIPDRAAVLQAMDSSIQRGTPFSLGHSVVDDAGVAHDVVVCGLPEVHDGRQTVRGVVLEVNVPGEEHVPTLTHRLSRLPDGITREDLPWAPDEPLPEGLLATLNLCLDSSAPTCLIWGEDRLLIYNRAYLEIAGPLHPHLFGTPIAAAWPEVWQVIAEKVDQVFQTGEPDTFLDQTLPIERDGHTQDCFFTYTYIPIRNDDDKVSGLFVPITETTTDVLRRRRLQTLHELAAEGVTDGSPEELYARLAGVLAANTPDIPFSLMYLVEPSDRIATLHASTGLVDAAGCAPEKLRLDAGAAWPVAEAISRGTPLLVDDVDSRFPGMLTETTADTPTKALISYVDLGHERLPNAINILGVGSRQALDAEYQGFLHKVARHLHADLAAVATAKLDRERSANLQRAMQSNRQIGAAIGILMTIHKVTEQQAFLLLSKASQQSNRKLRDIADDVILAGTLPPEVLAAPQRRPANRRKGGDRRETPSETQPG